MTAIGIIAEYNPFHTGHAHQLKQLRQRFGSLTPIIVLMSGAFVQRGEPALFSKQQRARWALLGGADLVIELPTAFSLCSAENFAAGGARLAAALGVDTLAFGARTADLQALQQVAAITLTAAVRENHHKYLKQGLFYGAALTKAIEDMTPEIAILLKDPNNLLAIEYLKAIRQYDLPLTPIVSLRQSNHSSRLLQHGIFPSGSAIRQVVAAQGDLSLLKPFLPAALFTEFLQTITTGAYTDYTRYGDMILTIGRCQPAHKLADYCEFSEGLANKWPPALQQPTWSDALNQIKSKRYSYSRLQRMGAYLLLRCTRLDMAAWKKSGPLYAHILAANGQGRRWLHEQTATIPLITKITKAQLSPAAAAMLQLDCRATDMQMLAQYSPAARQGRQDYYQSPVML